MAQDTIDDIASARTRARPSATPLASGVVHPAASEAPAAQELIGPQRFEFTGTGAEYFRIWVVNLLLTVLTLGIYSAWAKVRRLQYFYRNTRVAGSIFDYHGQPKAILKGRILALALLVAYKISYDVSVVAAVVVALLLAAITPWLLARAFHFKLANSSYRGLRFHFRGTVGAAYRMLILFPITLGFIGLFVWSLATSFSERAGGGVIVLVVVLPVLALAGTVPLAHYLLKRFQHDNADYGQTPFFFEARAADFFKVYGKAVCFFFLGAIPATIFGVLTARAYQFLLDTPFGWLFALLYGVLSAYAFYLFVRPYMESRIQNLVWNSTELSDHRFESTVSARKLLWIHASNLMLITVTCGLYKPFAAVRLVKYRVESMSLVPSGNLEEFLADQTMERADAIGQEAGDLFDIDIAL
ncbi:DUF898 domain-containing protein [Noviherbaspirillum cavernae]|uniref:DUF898 domain-containing protein n=1 Tax=Noviherbaspirillum cavernae TaxID=2320862 RepID=A0A418WYI1_9BURK|nr:YjgN family protein [Noviherbaspirillum cavernae]RJG05299.1 DUF898 domain-containing protein [Noviherbaspirillum cavernae]